MAASLMPFSHRNLEVSPGSFRRVPLMIVSREGVVSPPRGQKRASANQVHGGPGGVASRWRTTSSDGPLSRFVPPERRIRCVQTYVRDENGSKMKLWLCVSCRPKGAKRN